MGSPYGYISTKDKHCPVIATTILLVLKLHQRHFSYWDEEAAAASLESTRKTSSPIQNEDKISRFYPKKRYGIYLASVLKQNLTQSLSNVEALYTHMYIYTKDKNFPIFTTIVFLASILDQPHLLVEKMLPCG